tara:strand:- start:121 stop:1428 length:1308 start_codon:yes stop_codon:yes gene_type:complete
MANTQLTRTFTAGNRRTYTISLWLKRSSISSSPSYQAVFLASGGDDGIFFKNDNTLDCFFHGIEKRTNRAFRDTNAWYHIMVAVDSTQASASDRLKIYVNGEQETSFAHNTGDPAQDSQGLFNNSGGVNRIGNHTSSSYQFDGVMSHIHYCDGTALAPTVFGSTDSTTGEWKINTAPSFTPGTNGFTILKDGNTITDQSANSNDFTLASGTLTKTEDCPSNIFCTMNPLMVNSSATNTFANGNNTVSIDATDACIGATLGANSGKFYWEQKWTQQGANDRWGVVPDDAVMTSHPRTTGIGWDTSSTQFYLLGSAVSGSWGGSIGTSDIIQIALDLDNSALYLGVNGTYRNSGNPTSGSSRTGAVDFSSSSLVGKFLLPGFGKGNQDTSTMQYNFGNGYFGSTAVSSAGTNASNIGIFEHDVPTGYTALSTKGLNL